MDNNIYINRLEYKLGSQYTNETFNDEFKKFTFDRDEIKVHEKRNFFDIFFKTGKFNSTVNKYTKERLAHYLKNYIPKYTVCFLNSNEQHNLSHFDSFLYIGIDDDGIITGIPIDSSENLNDLHTFIETEIDKNIKNNISGNLIDHSMIKSCITSYIYIINNSYSDNCKQIMQQNKNKIVNLDMDRSDLFFKINLKKKYVAQIHRNASKITVGNFKKNQTIIQRILRNLIDHDKIPVTYNKLSTETLFFFQNLMANFDTKNYDENYEEKLNIKPSVSAIKYSKELYNALGTFFHIQIKHKSEIHKRYVVNKYLEEKQELTRLEEEFNKNLTEKILLYYDIDTHIDKITEFSNFILVKIRFDHQKYKNYTKNLIPHELKFNNEKNITIATKRKLKYIGNKLDPECDIVFKKKTTQ